MAFSWKSTALVSGTGMLATWLMSAPPQHSPAPAAPQAAAAAADDIVADAAGLRARVELVRDFQAPARDPFRFLDRRPASSPSAARTVQADGAAPAADTAPEPVMPPWRLIGMGSDPLDGTMVRTAVLAGPDGVTLVREGDVLAGRYRVDAVTEDGVVLGPVSPGAPLTLRFEP
ncbi:MAG: hypothetical protein AB7G23_05535 [Vicinamibacterales bacterium]